MKSLALDYRSGIGPAIRLARGALLVGGLTLLAASAVILAQRWQELALLRGQIEEVRQMSRRSAGTLRAKPGDSPAVEAEIRRANVVLEQLNLPWVQLLDAIESTRGEQVALLSVQPDARQRTVRVTAEAKSLGEALDYARRLGAHPRLTGVHFVNHEIVQQDAQKPVRVQLLAEWRREP